MVSNLEIDALITVCSIILLFSLWIFVAGIRQGQVELWANNPKLTWFEKIEDYYYACKFCKHSTSYDGKSYHLATTICPQISKYRSTMAYRIICLSPSYRFLMWWWRLRQ